MTNKKEVRIGSEHDKRRMCKKSTKTYVVTTKFYDMIPFFEKSILKSSYSTAAGGTVAVAQCSAQYGRYGASGPGGGIRIS